MKKLLSLIAVVTFAVFMFSSCEKEGTNQTKVINVELALNAAYSYPISNHGDEDDAMRITQQASHFSKSEITGSGSPVVFNYSPALDYVGSDEVIVSNEKEHKGHHSHGDCSGHHDEDVTVYDFKITVKGLTK